MGIAINLKQTVDVHVGITLCGRQGAVPEKLLNRPQVGSLLQHMGRKGVTQCMGVHITG